MTDCKTIPAPKGGYFGLYWNDEHRRYVKVGPVNGYSFDTAGDALRAAKHRVGNPFTMTACCPLPEPTPDLDALGINQWRQRKAGEGIRAQVEAFGTIRVKGRSVSVERKPNKRREIR